MLEEKSCSSVGTIYVCMYVQYTDVAAVRHMDGRATEP